MYILAEDSNTIGKECSCRLQRNKNQAIKDSNTCFDDSILVEMISTKNSLITQISNVGQHG